MGFTLVELLVVLALMALATSAVTLALRDTGGGRLQRDAERLALLLEQARHEARASGLAVSWRPGRTDAEAGDGDFRFIGLPASLRPPQRWLVPDVRAEVVGASAVVLGPEAVIGAQRVALHLGANTRFVSTAGLAPFAVEPDDALRGDAP